LQKGKGDILYTLISKLKQWRYINCAIHTFSSAHTCLLDTQVWDIGTILLWLEKSCNKSRCSWIACTILIKNGAL